MTGQYRTRKPVSTTIDNEIYDKFKLLATETRVASTKLLDEALEDLLVKYGKIDEKDKKTP